MAGFPIPILGVNGTSVVVGITLLWSLSEGRVCIWGGSLSLISVPRDRGEQWEEETISASLSTDVLMGFSSDNNPGNEIWGLLSSVVSVASDVLEAESSTVSGRVM